MNDSTLLKLKVIVERVVRPVKASLPWKMKTREELLAHVTAVFEDELPRCGDEAAALVQVEKRFGDPSELTRTLKKSLPASESFAFYMDRLLEPRAGESWFQQTARYGSLLIAYSGTLVSLGLILGTTKMPHNILVTLTILFGGMIFLPGMISTVSVLSNRLQQTLFTTSGRSIFKALLILMVSCLLPVFLPIAYCLVMLPFMSVSDSIALGLKILRILVPAAPLGPVIVIFAAKIISDGKMYREEWSKLQID